MTTKFLKLAFPVDPAETAEKLRAMGDTDTLKDLARGQSVMDALHHVPPAVSRAGSAARSLGNAVLAPAEHVGPPILRALGSAGRAVAESPALLKAGIGAAALAPILGGAFNGRQAKFEGQLSDAERDPDRTITASEKTMFSLDEFLEKKAAAAGGAGMSGPFGKMVGTSIRENLITGLGTGIGHGLVSAMGGAFGSGVDALRNYFVLDDKRKRLIDSLVRTDPVIHDAIERNPHGKQIIVESYETMVHVAPTLSLDLNAVRSFLREAIIGGAGVSYATIKNLAETESEVSRNKGGHNGRK